MSSRSHRAATVPLVCVLCLVAFALAVPQLGARYLWGDEAFSVWASDQPLITLIAGLDMQPPLYHLALKSGRALLGESEFAVRFVSVLCGILLTPISFQIGHILTGRRRAGLFCACMLALSPMLAYYAQEARMYAITALACGISMWITALGLSGRHLHRRHWAVYALASLAALYSHFYSVTILAVNTFVLLIAVWQRPVRTVSFLPWLMAHAAIAVGFGGWFFGLQWRMLARAVSGGSAAPARSLPPPLGEVLENVARGGSGLVFGMQFERWQPVAALGILALALAGAFVLWRAKRRSAVLLCSAWIGLSALFVFVTASRSGIVPDFSPRYLLFVLLPFAVLCAGCAAHTRLMSIGLMAVFAASGAGHLALADMTWQKSRYADMLDVIRARAVATDLTALLNSDQYPLLRYYGPLPGSTWLMSNELWDAGKREQLDSEFSHAAQDKTRVWLVKYGWTTAPGSQSVVEQRLQATSARLYYGEFGDVTLSLYERIAGDDSAPIQPRDFRLGDAIRLTGVRFRAERFRAGDAVPFEVFWRADAIPSADFTAFVHLRRADTGEQLSANDTTPVVPTSRWAPGQVISDTRGIQIPANAPPGDYQLIMGMYQFPSFERLPVNGGAANEFVVQTIVVEP